MTDSISRYTDPSMFRSILRAGDSLWVAFKSTGKSVTLGEVTCVRCGGVHPKCCFRKKSNGRFLYEDFEGSNWRGSTCPECMKNILNERDIASGRTSKVKTYPNHIKGEMAEIIARGYYEKLGYIVHRRGKGADLRLYRDGLEVGRVEVKYSDKSKHAHSWSVCKSNPNTVTGLTEVFILFKNQEAYSFTTTTEFDKIFRRDPKESHWTVTHLFEQSTPVDVEEFI